MDPLLIEPLKALSTGTIGIGWLMIRRCLDRESLCLPPFLAADANSSILFDKRGDRDGSLSHVITFLN